MDRTLKKLQVGVIGCGRISVMHLASIQALQTVTLVCVCDNKKERADEAAENLRWLAGEVSNEVELSLMSQYTPAYKALSMPPLDRAVSEEEYLSVTDEAERLGFENGWIQGFASADPDSPLLGENMGADHGSVG